MKVSADVVYLICKGFVQVMENLESHEIYKFHFPVLESLGKSKISYCRCQSIQSKTETSKLNSANSSRFGGHKNFCVF